VAPRWCELLFAGEFPSPRIRWLTPIRRLSFVPPKRNEVARAACLLNRWGGCCQVSCLTPAPACAIRPPGLSGPAALASLRTSLRLTVSACASAAVRECPNQVSFHGHKCLLADTFRSSAFSFPKTLCCDARRTISKVTWADSSCSGQAYARDAGHSFHFRVPLVHRLRPKPPPICTHCCFGVTHAMRSAWEHCPRSVRHIRLQDSHLLR
jgi:hypothetical protein